jgi:hypothetical protein
MLPRHRRAGSLRLQAFTLATRRLHWQVSFVPTPASAHAVLQCLLPSAGAQLQAGCAHFVVGVIEVLLRLMNFVGKSLILQHFSSQGFRTMSNQILRKLAQHCIDGSHILFRFAHPGHPISK